MQVILGTQNQDKRRELMSLLEGQSIDVLSLADYPGMHEVIEDGNTLEENALKKAREVSQFTGKLTLADDSGLFIDALEGRPGIYAARYSGPGATYESNQLKVLEEMKDVPWEQRGARFVTCIAIVDGSQVLAVLEGECLGKILMERQGTEGFGYDPIFQPDGYEQSFAQMSSSLKNQISHRAKALQKTLDFFKQMPC